MEQSERRLWQGMCEEVGVYQKKGVLVECSERARDAAEEAGNPAIESAHRGHSR